jgi:hypothetical protein
MHSRLLFAFAFSGAVASALILGAASSAAGAMTVSNALSAAGAPKIEKVIWCNRWRCGVGPGVFRPGAVGGVWHPWGYGVRPYRWCYYHPYQC